MDKQRVNFKDLGLIEYKPAWDYQESILSANLKAKALGRNAGGLSHIAGGLATTHHYFLLCEHPPVYTMGKNGKMEHILIDEEERAAAGISFYKTNRGGDITFHGPGQLVGYPILDLEKFQTDIGLYLRNIEEVIIRSLAGFGITAGRSEGETGVWLDAGLPGKERKICAIGVRCSRWVTMHGFALNVNTDLGYFSNIIPCGIHNKQVTSIQKELGYLVDTEVVKEKIKENFEGIFHVSLAASTVGGLL